MDGIVGLQKTQAKIRVYAGHTVPFFFYVSPRTGSACTATWETSSNEPKTPEWHAFFAEYLSHGEDKKVSITNIKSENS